MVIGTSALAQYEIGDYVEDFAGPLGQPSEMINEDIDSLKGQNILFVAGGVGAAPVYPQVKWLYEQGIKADVIIGARTKDLIILEDEMKKVAGNLYVSTDDGSYGFNGRVTDMLNHLVNNENKKYDHSNWTNDYDEIYVQAYKRVKYKNYSKLKPNNG
jgi:ferredoxin--NADP+ reductase